MRVVERGAEKRMQHDRRHAHHLLFWPGQLPCRTHPAVCRALETRLADRSRVQEQGRVHLVERLTCDRRQQVDLPCENGFLVPPTHGVAMHTVPEIDEMTLEAREGCGDHQAFRAGA